VCSGATPFDLAAAVVIAEEAGCPYLLLEGGQLDLSRKFTSIAFASHAALLREIDSLYELKRIDGF
jgi:fructose-1,6-bisphosphatase/inositol monophosphatase family enzyme